MGGPLNDTIKVAKPIRNVSRINGMTGPILSSIGPTIRVKINLVSAYKNMATAVSFIGHS